MVYRFIVLSDEVDNFRRDITIDSDATFYDLHEAILNSVDYTKDQMTSFFICDEDWAKETEITLVEMDSNADEDTYVMEKVHLSDLLDEERQKLVYVFEYLSDRSFFMELREIIPGKTQKKPEIVRSDGNPPAQSLNIEELDFLPHATMPYVEDEDFFDDEDIDGYDEEDIDNLIGSNPYDDY